MDILRLYHDFNIPYVTENHRHAHTGWINTPCPFCSNLPGSNPGYHLGWNLNEEYYSCYRCGWHSPVKTISELTGLDLNKTYSIIKEYGTVFYQEIKKPEKQKFQEPSFLDKLTEHHKAYLKSRGFNPDKLEKVWGLKSTSPISKLDKYHYSNRIYIPYRWNGITVSFDTRIPKNVGKEIPKYLACPEIYEDIDHKSIPYCNADALRDFGVVVEGTTDVWKIGEKKGLATSGIQYTHKQVHLIGTMFKGKKLAVWFDGETQAQVQAKKLIALFQSTYNIDAFNIKTEDDPGSFDQNKIKRILKNI